jgi:multidrug transporter EmrE-like cation transporter
MKAGSSMLSLSLYGQSQLSHPTFWIVGLAWAVFSVAAIWWLRKGLLHLPASRLLPVEYGCVTATSVLGGLILFREHQYVPAESLRWMGFGLLLICVGCALVGRRCMPFGAGRGGGEAGWVEGEY